MDENKELVRRLFDSVFNDRDLDLCDDIVATDYVEHAIAPFGGEEPGDVIGPEHMRNVVTWLVDQYPDMTMRIDSIVSEGDTVAARVWSEGTNLGKLNGVVPPTGKRFAGQQTHWYRVEGGKLAEHWAVRDDLGTMLQLGILNLPGPPA
ncbi:MAG: ester cyclase [Acidimicrobiia bacterium]|nr:ester cyclase [Acidimicrobiia bacterium]